MGFEDLYKFISSDERRKRELDFQKKIFPLGLEQKDFVLNALRPLVNSKIHDFNLLYAFITTKQKFIEDSECSARAHLEKQSSLSNAEKTYVMSLVLLDACVNSLEEYPNTSSIKSFAEKLEHKIDRDTDNI